MRSFSWWTWSCPTTTLNVGMLEAVRDLTMFPVGGMERNERQWRALLAKNGLRIKKIWRGTEPEACVECEMDSTVAS